MPYKPRSNYLGPSGWLLGAGLVLLLTGLGAQTVLAEQDYSFRVERFEANPIIHREMHHMVGEVGENINGPSLIRVPEWIDDPLGAYYLYFAHHNGQFIRLAYADHLKGPWKIHEGGVLPIEKTPGGGSAGHLASPDVHVDHDEQRIRMYYHQPVPGDTDFHWGQCTYVAMSEDGLRFEVRDEILGLPYFRVFEYNDWHYAIAKYGQESAVLYRSRDGLSDFTDFEDTPRALPRARHMAVWLDKDNNHLYVFYSRGEDKPERILVSRVTNLDDDWRDWEFSDPQTVLKPQKDFEGAFEPVERSSFGSTYDFVHQLRDPAIYVEDGRLYLLYSTAGEWAIAIAEIRLETE